VGAALTGRHAVPCATPADPINVTTDSLRDGGADAAGCQRPAPAEPCVPRLQTHQRQEESRWLVPRTRLSVIQERHGYAEAAGEGGVGVGIRLSPRVPERCGCAALLTGLWCARRHLSGDGRNGRDHNPRALAARPCRDRPNYLAFSEHRWRTTSSESTLMPSGSARRSRPRVLSAAPEPRMTNHLPGHR
jgi:hypothetical protein